MDFRGAVRYSGGFKFVLRTVGLGYGIFTHTWYNSDSKAEG